MEEIKYIWKIKKDVPKENLKNNVKVYWLQKVGHKIGGTVQSHIFELFKILQYKTGYEFRKSHLSEPLGKFLTFP